MSRIIEAPNEAVNKPPLQRPPELRALKKGILKARKPGIWKEDALISVMFLTSIDLHTQKQGIVAIKKRAHHVSPLDIVISFPYYFSFSSAAFSAASIAGISSFTQVPTLRRYQGEFLAEPNA